MEEKSTLEDLNYIKACIKNKVVPDENKISLKMYCDFFEKEIESHHIEVETTDGDLLLIHNNASRVSHIMDLHEFYDKKFKHKVLKFQGSFTTIQGFRNMKKKIITLETLKKSHNGAKWRKDSTRYRVLCFPYLNEALLYGTWYKFDINKYQGNTKLIPKYIVNYRVQNIQLNFCIDKDEDNDNYFCISNVIAYRTNPRIYNQDYLDIDRIIDYLEDNSINRCICHNRLYGSKLKNIKNCNKVMVSKSVHNKLIKNKCFINSIRQPNDQYDITFLKLDTNIKRYLK